MTRMERKRRRQENILNALIMTLVCLALLFALEVLSEMDESRAMLESSAMTAKAAEVVLEDAKELLVELEEERLAPVEEQEVVILEVEEPARYFEEIPLDEELQGVLLDSCEEFGVPFPLALAVMEQESRFQMVSGDGGNAAGYFQVWEKWWSWLMEEIGTDDLTDPADNVRTGCAVLGHLLGKYETETDALSAYNTGKPGTTKYATEVMGRKEKWEVIVCQE